MTPVSRRWDRKRKVYVHSLRPLAFYFCPVEATVNYYDLLLCLHHGCRITLGLPLHIDIGIGDRAPSIRSALVEFNTHPMWGGTGRPLTMLADFPHIIRECKQNLKLLETSDQIAAWRTLQAEEDGVHEDDVGTFQDRMVLDKIRNLHICRCASTTFNCVMTIPNPLISPMQDRRNVRAIRWTADGCVDNSRPERLG